MKRIFLLSFFCILLSRNFSQDIISSNLHIRTCVDTIRCNAANDLCWLFYDESKNIFYLKVDLAGYKTSTKLADEWLRELSDTIIYFKGYFPKENFPPITNSASRSYQVSGQLFLNGVWRDHNVEISILSSDKNLLNQEKSSSYDAYEVNFGFSFLPAEFRINYKPEHMTKPVFVAVTRGRINLLKPGMEKFVGGAYNKD